jgi:hypothetical protein
MLLPNIWASITVFTQGIITELKADYPDVDIQYIDWETHANVSELPNADLIGPTSLTFMEVAPQLIEVNFAIAVSTYGTDQNLFRHRDYIGRIFEKLRPEKQIVYFDAAAATVRGFLVCTDGTMVAPMTRADVRPFQFVQSQALLEPSSSS